MNKEKINEKRTNNSYKEKNNNKKNNNSKNYIAFYNMKAKKEIKIYAFQFKSYHNITLVFL